MLAPEDPSPSSSSSSLSPPNLAPSPKQLKKYENFQPPSNAWKKSFSAPAPSNKIHAFARPPLLEALSLLPLAMRVKSYIEAQNKQGRGSVFDLNGIALDPPHPGPHAGIPLGGIGGGSIGRGYKGEFRSWSLTPGKYIHRTVRANQFSVRIRFPSLGTVYTRVLSHLPSSESLPFLSRMSTPSCDLPPPLMSNWGWGRLNQSQCCYHALFPRSWTVYKDVVPGIHITIKQTSPFLPGRYSESSLPCAAFEVIVDNDCDVEAEVSVMFTFQNGSGGDEDERGNLVHTSFGHKLGGLATNGTEGPCNDRDDCIQGVCMTNFTDTVVRGRNIEGEDECSSDVFDHKGVKKGNGENVSNTNGRQEGEEKNRGGGQEGHKNKYSATSNGRYSPSSSSSSSSTFSSLPHISPPSHLYVQHSSTHSTMTTQSSGDVSSSINQPSSPISVPPPDSSIPPLAHPSLNPLPSVPQRPFCDLSSFASTPHSHDQSTHYLDRTSFSIASTTSCPTSSPGCVDGTLTTCSMFVTEKSESMSEAADRMFNSVFASSSTTITSTTTTSSSSPSSSSTFHSSASASLNTSSIPSSPSSPSPLSSSSSSYVTHQASASRLWQIFEETGDIAEVLPPSSSSTIPSDEGQSSRVSLKGHKVASAVCLRKV